MIRKRTIFTNSVFSAECCSLEETVVPIYVYYVDFVLLKLFSVTYKLDSSYNLYNTQHLYEAVCKKTQKKVIYINNSI